MTAIEVQKIQKNIIYCVDLSKRQKIIIQTNLNGG